jgi:hypothetical protein
MVAIDRTSQAAGQRRALDVQLDPEEYIRFLETRPSTKVMANEYLSGLERSDSKSFQRMEICGLLGALRFTEGYYLVVIKEAAQVGRLGCHEIFRVEEMDLVQVSYEVAGWTTRIPWTSAETKNKQKLLGAHLEKDFYFSHTYLHLLTADHFSVGILYVVAADQGSYCAEQVRSDTCSAVQCVRRPRFSIAGAPVGAAIHVSVEPLPAFRLVRCSIGYRQRCTDTSWWRQWHPGL